MYNTHNRDYEIRKSAQKLLNAKTELARLQAELVTATRNAQRDWDNQAPDHFWGFKAWEIEMRAIPAAERAVFQADCDNRGLLAA